MTEDSADAAESLGRRSQQLPIPTGTISRYRGAFGAECHSFRSLAQNAPISPISYASAGATFAPKRYPGWAA